MRVISHKLQSIPYVITYLNKLISDETISFELLSEAPLWLKLLSRGQYCGYKNVIYVPKVHLELVSSEYDTDKTLATAKMLPWIMCFHDGKNRISVSQLLKLLFFVRYQIHYTLYELLFLKATNNKFYQPITLGFMITRRHFWSFKKLAYDKVEAFTSAILEHNKPN